MSVLAVRLGYVTAVFGKEWRDISQNRLLLVAVVVPALIFAAIPTGIVAVIERYDIDPDQLYQIERYLANFPGVPPKLAAQSFIILNFMAYFLLIPAMVPMAIATQSVVGEKQARSLEPQLASPLEVTELLAGKTIAAALPAIGATWGVFVLYGLVNGAIADPRLTLFVFSDVWLVAMATLVPLISLFSVLLGIVVSSRVGDARTAQQIGGFVVIPIIGVAVAQFFGGQATFDLTQVIVGDLMVAVLIGVALVIGSWAFDRETILTRLG
jgi:ABC-2 type transport system permease protein